ncbi:MAG: sugar ABC transporter substrate-binding protein [Gemmatimonadaceae bacterium]|nr:sugar ABC transporter substrate-binding protein [Gemmatimonadaceae bacterium]
MSGSALRRGLVGALVIVAACGRARAPSGDVQLTMWAFGREGEVVQELMRDFEAAHPGIRVKVQQIPWMAAHEKLLTSYVGEMLPDIAQLGNTWIAEFETLDALAPLDSLIAGSRSLSRAAFFPGIWATNVVAGRTLGVPWYVDTRLLFYRRDLFERAGILAPPSTWDEWLVAMRRVKQLTGTPYGIFLPLSEWNPLVIFAMQAGSPLLTPGGLRGAFTDAPFRDAFAFYARIFDEGLAPRAGQQQLANVHQEFARGTFAMYITGPWQLGEFATRMPPALRGAWATAPMPGPRGDSSGISMAGGSSLVMFRGSRHPAEAWALIEWLSQPSTQLEFYRISGNLPPTYAAWQDPLLANNAHAAAFRTQLDRLRPLPAVPEWEQVATKVIEYQERVVRGVLTIDQAVVAMNRDVDRLLEKRRWIAERGQGADPR